MSSTRGCICEKCKSTQDVAFIPTGYDAECGFPLFTCATCQLKAHTRENYDSDKVEYIYSDLFGTNHDRAWDENLEMCQRAAHNVHPGACDDCWKIYSADCFTCQRHQDELHFKAQQYAGLHRYSPKLFPAIAPVYLDGRKAFVDGLAFEANPYLRTKAKLRLCDSSESNLALWWAGWTEAEQDTNPDPNRDSYVMRVYQREALPPIVDQPPPG